MGLSDEFTVNSIVQQGSVSGGLLCTAATGEVVEEINSGGCQLGELTVKVLIFVDDIASTNTDMQDHYRSHEKIVWFSNKKRLTLNGPKCMTMLINGKPSDVVPRLKINGIPLARKVVVTYLGDQFNERGDNKDLIEDRRQKGHICLVNSLSLCSDVTMGLFIIQTMLILYKGLFLAVVLYNSQAWSNLTKQDLKVLTTMQLKFLKRIFHSPASTSNCLTFLETGTLPIEQEIHKRQLSFLYHILSLHDDDPVRICYMEQLKYECAPNWANEVKQIRKRYNITENDDEISELSKDKWKYIVKSKIKQSSLDSLKEELTNQKQHAVLDMYEELEPQEYISELPPSLARTVFHIRTGTVDLKSVRKYKYQDTVCRLCGNAEESVEHVVNHCAKVARTRSIENIYNATNRDDMVEVARRCNDFAASVDEIECSGSVTSQ